MTLSVKWTRVDSGPEQLMEPWNSLAIPAPGAPWKLTYSSTMPRMGQRPTLPPPRLARLSYRMGAAVRMRRCAMPCTIR
jgi:hypothetical protein